MAQGRKTGGRKAGVPNKSTAPIRELLDACSRDGRRDLDVERLHALTQHEDPHVAVKALALKLAYRFGKPTEHHEHTGADGGPIQWRDVFVAAAP